MRFLQTTPLRKALVGVVVLVGVFALGLGHAHAVPLSDLLVQGASIKVGDKTFESFMIDFDKGSKALDATRIDVTGLTIGDIGLKFMAMNDALTVSGGDFIDLGLSFKVTADPGMSIIGTSLDMTGGFNVVGDGMVQIDDFAFDTDFMGLGEVSVDADLFGSSLTDSIEFAAQTSMFQEIDIMIDSGSAGDLTGITMFEVRKAQIIPEPETLALFLIGLVGLGWLRWRQAGRAGRHANVANVERNH